MYWVHTNASIFLSDSISYIRVKHSRSTSIVSAFPASFSLHCTALRHAQTEFLYSHYCSSSPLIGQMCVLDMRNLYPTHVLSFQIHQNAILRLFPPDLQERYNISNTLSYRWLGFLTESRFCFSKSSKVRFSSSKRNTRQNLVRQ